MPTLDTPTTQYGSKDLTNQQAVNESKAQSTRFGLPVPKEASATPAAEVPMLSTESAVDTVNKAKDTEKFLTGNPTKDTKYTSTNDVSTNDLTKFFQDGELPAGLTEVGQKAREELDSFIAGLDSFRISNAELNNQVKGIVQGYNSRIAQMEDIGKRREKTFETLGFRTGGQFSGGVRGGVFGGVIAEEERQGLMRINQLEAEKQSEITKAKEAARDKNWQVYVQQVQLSEKKYKEQIDNIEKLNKLYIDQQNKMEEEKKALDKVQHEVTVDKTIKSLLDQGITDPGDILDYINFNDTGELVGDVTKEEIDASLKFLNKTQDLTGLSSSVRDFKTFFPNADLGTAEGYQQYLRFKAQTAASTRKPTTANDTQAPTIVEDNNGDILSYDEWKFTDEAKQILKQDREQQLAEKGTSAQTTATADKLLKQVYDDAAMQYYRDNPKKGKLYTAANVPPPLKEVLLSDIKDKATLDELYNAYPDISTSYISSLYNSLNKKKKEDTTMSDADISSMSAADFISGLEKMYNQ